MSAAADRARFYLEQQVPQLQEFERKGLFTREEIRSIASKRSNFEHAVNATGSKPSDYARYITYELNLEALRKKRAKRLGVKKTGSNNGQRTVLRLLDRATKKFPGDLGLWMQYITFCRQQKAHKKLEKVFTQVLRLKPRDWTLWVLAAKFYAEDRLDMAIARSYMQRGLRFCKDEPELWLEYARLEMVWLVKIGARRKLVGLDKEQASIRVKETGNNEEEDEDIIMLPALQDPDKDADLAATDKSVEDADPDTSLLQQLASTPALNGALPIAIFDGAMKQFGSSKNRTGIAERFFDLVASFEEQVAATRKVLQHIFNYSQTVAPESAETIIFEAKMTLLGIDPMSADFPAALGSALKTMGDGMNDLIDKQAQQNLAEGILRVLLPYLSTTREEELDEDIQTVLERSVGRYVRLLVRTTSYRPAGKKEGEGLEGVLKRLRDGGRDEDAALLEEYWEKIPF